MKMTKDSLERIFTILNSWKNLDFRQYKDQTIKRRILRRANLLSYTEIEDYITHLSANPNEIETLYNDLLISVTSFFRDSDSFIALQETIIPELIGKASEDLLRVWVPACSTGQEAYSIAIAIFEEFTKQGIAPNYRIFATDVSEETISIAASGVYFHDEMEGISPSRIEKNFYSVDEKRLRIQPKIRSRMTFVKQNILTDPPFPDLDLISCRNLLIYFKNTAQQNILSSFHFALNNRNGYLFLGNSEGLSGISKGFEKLETSYQIYQKKAQVKIPFGLRTIRPKPISIDRRRTKQTSPTSGNSFSGLYDNFIAKYVSPGIIVDENEEIIHINGNVGKFFPPPQGRFSPNLSGWLPEELKIAIKASLKKITKNSPTISLSQIPINNLNYSGNIDIQVSSFAASENNYYFIQMTDNSSNKKVENKSIKFNLSKGAEEHITCLEEEIRELQSNLYCAMDGRFSGKEELEGVNEELRSSNEELQSSNEELQAITHAYEKKINELTSLNNDINNLNTATNIGTIFVDENLRLRTYSNVAAKMLSLSDNNTGRALTAINHELINTEIITSDFQKALTKSETSEREIQLSNNSYYFYRLLPFKEDNGTISGAVITYTEITKLKNAEVAKIETENKFKAAVEAVNDAIWSFDIVTGVFDFSKQWLKIMGYASQELTTLDLESYLKLVFIEDKEKVWFAFDKLINRGGNFDIEFRVQCKNGSFKWMRSRGRAIPLNDYTNKRILLGTNSDISAMKELEIERAHTQQILSLLCDGVGLGFWQLDSKTGIVKLDHTAKQILNIFVQPAKWDDIVSRCNPSDIDEIKREMFKLSAQKATSVKLEIRIQSAKSWKWIRINGIRISKQSNIGNFEMVGFIENIDTRKNAEKVAIENEVKYLHALQISNILTWSYDFATNFLESGEGTGLFKEKGDVNPISIETIIKSVAPKDRKSIIDCLSPTSLSENSEIEIRLHAIEMNTVSGDLAFINIFARKVFDNNGKQTGIVGILKDITNDFLAEQKAKEYSDEMERQQQLFTSVIENIPLAVLAKNMRDNSKYYICNAAAENLFELPRAEIIGNTDFTFLPRHRAEENMKQDQLVIQNKTFVDIGEIKLDTKSNIKTIRAIKIPALATDGSVESIFVFMEDISERILLSAQLRQAQKMDAVGRLAGGIAHDFNNMMQAVIGYGSLLEDSLKADTSEHENVKHILSAAEQAAELVKQLMAFSHKSELITQNINMTTTVKSVVRMVDRLIGDHIKIETNFTECNTMVLADINQIKQALVNICLNAKDVMPDGGIISIDVDKVKIAPVDCHLHASATPGSYVVTTICDTGTGIPLEIVELIFEPFFTTKQIGRGTGLGLASVYAILERHDGFIIANNSKHGGACFTIYLPEHFNKQINKSKSKTNTSNANFASVGTETILLAEDEKMIREFTSKILKKAGYKVIAAKDGAEAVKKFKANENKIDLLMFDVMMPDMNGRQAAEQIEQLQRGVPILYCSGYGSDLLKSEYMVEINGRLISKPYKARDLLKEIRIILDRNK